MEYGQIFHVMRIGKYYCKNMKYRINSIIACQESDDNLIESTKIKINNEN